MPNPGPAGPPRQTLALFAPRLRKPSSIKEVIFPDGNYDNAEDWHKSKIIREFVRAVHSNSKESSNTAALEEWREWALEQADRLDPLAEGTASILDEEKALLAEEQEDARRW